MALIVGSDVEDLLLWSWYARSINQDVLLTIEGVGDGKSLRKRCWKK
jgi:hypothetical protein